MQFFGTFYWTLRHCSEDIHIPVHPFWHSPAIQYKVVRNKDKVCISYSIQLQSEAMHKIYAYIEWHWTQSGKWKSFLSLLFSISILHHTQRSNGNNYKTEKCFKMWVIQKAKRKKSLWKAFTCHAFIWSLHTIAKT